MLTTVSNFHSEDIIDYNILTSMCKTSKDTKNSALYMIRQHFFATGKFLGYNALDKIYKKEKAKLYYQNNSWVSQAILKSVCDDFGSFFALLKKKNAGQYQAKVKIPKYQKDSGLRGLSFGGPALKIEDGMVRLSLSKFIENRFKKKFLLIKIPKNIKGEIRQVEVVPSGNKNFTIHFMYEEEKLVQVEESDKILSIDLGVNNLCAMIDSDGNQMLINGKVIKNYNQLYNKEISKLKSKRDLEKNKWKKEKTWNGQYNLQFQSNYKI